MTALPWVQTSDGVILVTSAMATQTADLKVVRSPVRKEHEPWPTEPGYAHRSDLGVRVEVKDLIVKVLGKNQWGLPLSWALGMVYAESRGDESALAPDGGVGLTQITHPSLKGNRTVAELLDPETNLTIGLGFFYRIASKDPLLPRAAATYNAGGVYPQDTYSRSTVANPWKMRCSLGYIDRVVAAANAAERWLRDEAEKVEVAS